MAIYFLDSSALVKRYINETGSAWVLGLFDPTLDNELYIADLEDENRWDVSFERTQDNLVAATRKAKQEIAAGQSVLMNYDQL